MDKLDTLGLVESLKDSDLSLESKMAKQNQNNNSKQPDRPDPVQNLYFALERNE